MNVTVKVSMHGPFFQHGAAPVLASLHAAIEELTLRGEGFVVKEALPRDSGGIFHSRQYASAHGYKTSGSYGRDRIEVRVESMHGRIWDKNAVYGPWLEGVSTRNQATRFKGYAIFRRMKDKLQGMAHGILQKHVQKALDRLR